LAYAGAIEVHADGSGGD